MYIFVLFYLLANLSVYAADQPKKVSYAAEKAEVEATCDVSNKENNMLRLEYPTNGGLRIFDLDLQDEEPISFISYQEEIDEEDKKGLPVVFCLSTNIENGKEFSRVYNWPSVESWLLKGKPDPFTRKVINSEDLYFFLVQNRHTLTPKYVSTFLYNGPDAKIMKPLVGTLERFSNEPLNEDPAVKRARFYTVLVGEYFEQKRLDLALKFIEFGLQGIIGHASNNPNVINYRNFLLRKSGDIYRELGDINSAIQQYNKAIGLNDYLSLQMLREKLYSQLNNEQKAEHLALLEEKAKSESDLEALIKINTNLAILHKIMGNKNAANDAEQRNKDLAIAQSLKRQRSSSPMRTQSSSQMGTPEKQIIAPYSYYKRRRGNN